MKKLFDIYPKIVNNSNISKLSDILDEIIQKIPEKSIFSFIYFSFDDTIRLILDLIPDEDIQIELINKINKSFFEALENINIEENERKIEEIRKNILLTYYIPSNNNEKFVKQFMKIIYEKC